MVKATLLTAVSSLVFAACASKPPITHLYAIDTDHSVCAKYLITDHTKLTVDPNGEDLPIEACNGFIAIHSEEFKDFQHWVQKAQERAKAKAGRAKLEVESDDLKKDFEDIEAM